MPVFDIENPMRTGFSAAAVDAATANTATTVRIRLIMVLSSLVFLYDYPPANKRRGAGTAAPDHPVAAAQAPKRRPPS
jgi:hypothetical protein